MKKIIIGCIVTMFFCNISMAQKTLVLSTNTNLTIEEINKLYTESVYKNQKEEADAIIAMFPQFWNSLNSNEQLGFIEVANIMFKHQMKPIPQLANFINTYKTFSNAQHSQKSTQNFIKSMKYIAENNVNQFNNTMKIYNNFIGNNIFNTFMGANWRARNVDLYYFDFDTLPKIVLPKLDLIAENGKDSIVIKNTSGVFYPTTMDFIGEKGVVNWEKAGLGEQVYATIQTYQIVLKSTRIEIENAIYHNPKYLMMPQLGKLEDRVMTTEVSEEKATYPRFSTYDKNITIKNIYPEVDFRGGMNVRGATILGKGEKESIASLIFHRENKPSIIARSTSFLFKDNKISSAMCNIVLYIDNDSITHSAIELDYASQNREMWLMRGKDGPMRMPFINTYHNIDMYSEALHWKLKEENIEFCAIPGPTSSTQASFESINYFTAERMNKFMGFNDVNPMYTLYEYFRVNRVKSGTMEDIATFFNYAKTDVQSLIFHLVQYGFVDYDIITEKVIYRDKLGNYLFNDVQKKDYDILQFHSNVASNQTNATLSMINYDLSIKGIDMLIVSDSQIVNIFPKDKKITMQKNRDFLFHGKVEAGLFDFWVNNAKFNYDPFTMDFSVIDSIVFYVEDKSQGENAMGEFPLVKVRSYISDISGTLYIDQANNKSSTLNIPGYPRFESKSPGKVYYDHSFVYNGVYDRERFYFVTERFEIKDLADFDTDSLTFDGFLYSGGIFPEIVKPLKVRPDFSLGFVYNTSEVGLPAYQNKGTFIGKVDLSNRGLRCSGTVDYVQSKGEGKNIVFFLDSAVGTYNNFEIAEQMTGTEFPKVIGKNDSLLWLPYEDMMKVNSRDYKFRMYDVARHDGELIVSPNGLVGSGLFYYDISIMRSQNYAFKHHEMFAQSLDIDLYDSLLEDYHIRAYDHKAYVNFEEKRGNFIANSDVQPLLFPINMYKTYSKEFDWLVPDKKLMFKYEDPYANIDIPTLEIRDLYEMQSKGNELISTHPAQKGLEFTAVKATYDFVNYEIKAEGVRYIEVADAAIFPQNGIVKIYRRAEMAKLENSKVLANLNNKYHEIFRTNILIESKDAYKGDGRYNYVDIHKKKQEIYLDSIWVDRYQNTRAMGSISEETGFKLNPYFGYSGKVTLKAEEEFLTMRGIVSLLYSCDTNQYAPIRFEGAVNPDSVLIPITEKTRDTNNRPVVAAIASTSTGELYPAFARAKDQINNPEYISVLGYLTYNEDTNAYVVASKEKLEDLSLPGNVIYLFNKQCIARGEGKLNLGTNFGRMEFVPVGSVTNFIENDSAIIDVSVSMNFYFNEACMKLLSDFIESSQNLEPVDIVESQSYQTALLELLGDKEYDKYYPELVQYYHFKKLPKALQVSFMFADMEMVWKQENKAFVSVGDLGIAVCGEKEVNKYVPGLMEIHKKSTNKNSNNKTSMQLYLEFDNQWFYFNYSGQTMQALSSMKEFNNFIKETSQEKKILKADAKKGLAPYRYTIASLSTKKKFLNKYEYNVEDTD